MDEITSADFGLLKRQVRDTNALCGNIQHLLRAERKPQAMARPGGLCARLAFVAVRSLAEKRARDEVSRQFFPVDRDLHRLIERAGAGPATTSTAGWASELVGIVVADILDNLLPASVLTLLRQRSGLEFAFADGAIVRLPSHSPTPNGAFIAEGGGIPVARLLLSSLSLTPKKAASVTAFSRELANGTAVNVEQSFRLLLEQDLGLAVDAILLDGNAATTIRPQGLLNGLTPLVPAATGTPAEKIAADVRALFTAVAPALVPVLIVSTVEAAVLDVAAPGLAKIASVSLPVGTVIAADAASFVSAVGLIDFQASENPLVHMDDAPAPISASGSPNTVSAPTQSLWQSASIGLRSILDVNWALRRANAVSFMTGVSW